MADRARSFSSGPDRCDAWQREIEETELGIPDDIRDGSAREGTILFGPCCRHCRRLQWRLTKAEDEVGRLKAECGALALANDDSATRIDSLMVMVERLIEDAAENKAWRAQHDEDEAAKLGGGGNEMVMAVMAKQVCDIN